MRPDLTAGTLALLTDGHFDCHWQIEVENGSGTMEDLSEYLHAISGTLPNPDQPIASLDAEFIREANDDGSLSLAPLMGASTFNRLDDNVTYSALLQVGRDVVARVALTARGAARPASGYYEVFRGKIRRVEWPQQYGNARIICNDQSGALQLTKSETAYTYASGASIEAAIQDVLDNNGFSSITLNVPVATSKVLGPAYEPGQQKTVWEQVWALAQSIGWVVWWRYQADGAADLTLFEPSRTKTTPDFVFPFTREITALDIDEEDIGNVGYGEITNSSGDRVTVGPVEDATSIAKYGGIRRTFWIVEAEDSPVRTTTDMTALLTHAVSDLKEPDAIQTAQVGAFLFGEVSVDLYTWPANDITYDDPQDLAPFAISFSHRAGEDHQGTVSVRGTPTAGAKVWKGRGGRVVQDGEDGAGGDTVEPGGEVHPVLNHNTGTASANLNGTQNTLSWRILAATSALSEASVRAATAKNGRIIDAGTVGTLLSGISPGATVYFGAFAYTNSDGGGTESTFIDFQVPFGVGGAGLGSGAVTQTHFSGGKVVASWLSESVRDFGYSGAFSASDSNTVAWAAGTLTLSDGTSYSISGSNTGDMGGETFIYWDPGISTTAFQTTTSLTTATGERKIKVAYARPATDSSQKAFYVPAVGQFGINGDNIQAGSVLAAHVKAGEINANHITSISLSAIQAVVTSLSAITANIGTITAGSISGVTGTFSGTLALDSATGNKVSFRSSGTEWGYLQAGSAGGNSYLGFAFAGDADWAFQVYKFSGGAKRVITGPGTDMEVSGALYLTGGGASWSLQHSSVSGNIDIGAPGVGLAYYLETDGDAHSVAGTWTDSSDLRLKRNLTRLDGALRAVSNVTGYRYERIRTGRTEVGLVAQELQKVLPEAVRVARDANGDPTLGIAYGRVSAMLVEAQKELVEAVLAAPNFEALKADLRLAA